MIQVANHFEDASETSSISTPGRSQHSGRIQRSSTAPSAPSSRRKRQTLDLSTLSGFPGINDISGIHYEIHEVTQQKPAEPKRSITVSDPSESRRKHQSLDLSSLSGFPGEFGPPAPDGSTSSYDPLGTLDEELAVLEPFVPDQPRSRQSLARNQSVVANSPYVRSRLRAIPDRPVEYRRADRPTRLPPPPGDPDAHEPLPVYAEETNSTLPLRHRPAAAPETKAESSADPIPDDVTTPSGSITVAWEPTSAETHPALRTTFPIGTPQSEEPPSIATSERVSPVHTPRLMEYYAPVPIRPPRTASPSLQQALPQAAPHVSPQSLPSVLPQAVETPASEGPPLSIPTSEPLSLHDLEPLSEPLPILSSTAGPVQAPEPPPILFPTAATGPIPMSRAEPSAFMSQTQRQMPVSMPREDPSWRRNRAAELQRAYKQSKPKKRNRFAKCAIM